MNVDKSSAGALIDPVVSLPLFHIEVWILRALLQPLVVSRLRLDLLAHEGRELHHLSQPVMLMTYPQTHKNHRFPTWKSLRFWGTAYVRTLSHSIT